MDYDKEEEEAMDALPDTQMGCDWCGRKKVEAYLIIDGIMIYYCCEKCSKKERIITLPDCEC